MAKLGSLAVLAVAMALGACATSQTDLAVESAQSGSRPWKAQVAEAVFYPENTEDCGPAVLAMALTASGKRVAPDDLVGQVMRPGQDGKLTVDLISATRRNGRLAYPITDIESLLAEIDRGRPVVVLRNTGLSMAPQWRFALAVGYDLSSKTITLHTGSTPNFALRLSTFESDWRASEHWGLVVLTPGKLPASPDRTAYLRAALGLERAGQPAAARIAYEAALTAWPEDLTTLMGLGNVSYKLGKRGDAARFFTEAVRAHPQSGDAHNNLAQLLLEQGRLSQATEAVNRAISLGGPNLAIYRATRAAIRAAERNTQEAMVRVRTEAVSLAE
jgi:tetratricopeptide (TPR) repeat protein